MVAECDPADLLRLWGGPYLLQIVRGPDQPDPVENVFNWDHLLDRLAAELPQDGAEYPFAVAAPTYQEPPVKVYTVRRLP